MRFEIKRKLFHLLGLIYVAGILFLPRSWFVGVVGVLFLLDVVWEILRFRFPTAMAAFIRPVGGLFREDEFKNITGVFWMLLGVLFTAVVIEPKRIAATIYLYVIFGDGAASLVGKGLGGPHWPGSKKRLSGSAACFLISLVAGSLMLHPFYSWVGIWLGALSATILEFGFFNLNDNFSIPAGCSLVFLFTYSPNPLNFFKL